MEVVEKVNEKDLWEAASEAIRAKGARVTTARARVFAVLLGATEALSEPQIEAVIDGPKLDCVTIYRVLEWLSEVRLVHRVSGQDGVWRFAPLPQGVAPNAVFECDYCMRVLPLFDVPETRADLPEGFTGMRSVLHVFGRCPRCVDRAEPTPATKAG